LIERVKEKLWEIMRDKQISLAMLFNQTGDILWHRGRNIAGKNVTDGDGFSRSRIVLALENRQVIEEANVVVNLKRSELPRSALMLDIKSLMIIPVGDSFYLYADSGVKEGFGEADREVIHSLGLLLSETIEQVKRDEKKAGGISGCSQLTQDLRHLILRYAIEDESVLLLGETGVGNSHYAGLIHQYSGRSGKFVTINCPSIPDNLIESEIFGYKKGSFTDAKTDKRGLIAEAEDGTLFFDEIADVPLAFQAKLLRFIETHCYLVLGDPAEKSANVRILAATNKDLAEEIRRKRFREDLYYRLHVLEVTVPPLRQRKEDLMALLDEYSHHLKGKAIGDDFQAALQEYDWPGNIRELITVLRRLGIHSGEIITALDLKDALHRGQAQCQKRNEAQAADSIWAEIQAGQTFWRVVREPFLKRQLDAGTVRRLLEIGMAQCGGRYIDLLPLFNLPRSDYKRFLNFLSTHHIMDEL